MISWLSEWWNARARLSFLHSHWSRANDVWLLLVEMVHGVAPPALLCHKEPYHSTPSTRGISCLSLILYDIRVASMHGKDPLRAPLCHKNPIVGGFGCLELVLYGIRGRSSSSSQTSILDGEDCGGGALMPRTDLLSSSLQSITFLLKQILDSF